MADGGDDAWIGRGGNDPSAGPLPAALPRRGPPPSLDEAGVVRGGRGRRPVHRRLLAAVAGVAVVAAAAPFLTTDSPGAGPAADAPATTGPIARPEDVRPFGGPPRGSLAGDRAFLEAVRRLPWPGAAHSAVPEPPVATRHVVFAGGVPGGRWAMVVAPDPTVMPPDAEDADSGAVRGPGRVLVAWFTGPRGAAPEQLTPQTEPYGRKDENAAALHEPRTGTLLVVAAPGDEVEVSERPEISATGTTTRVFRAVDAPDGIAVTTLPPSDLPGSAAAAYRVHRGGVVVNRSHPDIAVDPAAAPSLPLVPDHPRGVLTGRALLAARTTAAHILAPLGRRLDEVEVTALWTGGVPDPGSPGQGALVTVTLPNGAVVVTAEWLLPTGDAGGLSGTECGRAVLPAGMPAARRVYAVACDVADGTGPMHTSLVVVAPPEVTTVRAYAADYTFLSEHPTTDGVLVVPLPLGIETVEAVTARGINLGRVALLGHAVDLGG